MSSTETVITPQMRKLYVIGMLLELRKWSDEYKKAAALCADGAKKEAADYFFEDGREAELDAYLAAKDQMSELESKALEWKQDMREYFNSSEESMADSLEDMLFPQSKNKKKKAADEERDEFMQMTRWSDGFSGKLWRNGEKNGWADSYLNLLADYMCADERQKGSADFDRLICQKVSQINQLLNRGSEYKSAQAILLEKLEERQRKNSNLNLNTVMERYMPNALVEQANTFGADNHIFRCMAAGCFYLPKDQFGSTQYSDYFIQKYGECYNLSGKTVSRKKQSGSAMNLDDMLRITEDTYGKAAADAIARKLRSRGLSSAEFAEMNSFDAARVLQTEWNAANQNGRPSYFRDICGDAGIMSPYQKQAQKFGMMLAMGQHFAEELDKGKNMSEALKALELKTIKTDKFMVMSSAWRDYFQGQYPNYSEFAEECAKVYRAVSGDFKKNGFGDYYTKWVEAMCQRGDYNPKFDGIEKPFEINMHHKMPVKMAKNLDNQADINDGANFLMFVQFRAPTGEKLTKHEQEHAKESNSTAALNPEPDARFYASSGNVTLSYSRYQEPQSFAKLRAQMNNDKGGNGGNAGLGGKEGR